MSISFNAPGGKGFWTFNFGHLLTVLSMLGGVSVMALTVQSKLTEHEVKLQNEQLELSSIKTDLREIASTLQRVAIDVAGIQGANRARNFQPAEKRGETVPGEIRDGHNTTVRVPMDPG